MAEDVKTPAPPPPPEGEKKPTAEQAIPPAQGAAVPSAVEKTAVPAAPKAPAAEKPAAAAAPAKPAAPAAKPAAPAKPTGPVPMPWTSPLVEKYKSQYGSGLDA